MKITASEWARRNGKSRFWASELCRAGRFPSAEKVGTCWMLEDSERPPAHMKRGPVPSMESARFQRMAEAAAKRAEYAERVAAMNGARMAARKAIAGPSMAEWQQQIIDAVGEIGTAVECRIDSLGQVWATPVDMVGVIPDWTLEKMAFYEEMGGSPA